MPSSAGCAPRRFCFLWSNLLSKLLRPVAGIHPSAMDKPCVALTSMGGSAEALSNDVLADDYERFVRQGDLSETDLRSLSEYWRTDESEDAKKENRTNADKIVSLTQMLAKAKNQAKKETFDVLKWILVGVAGLLVFWLVVYYNMPHLARMVAFFGLLYATALIGAGLRNLVDYQSNAVTRLTTFGLLIDLVISAVVAFGLSLLYLVGGISFTGKVSCSGRYFGGGYGDSICNHFHHHVCARLGSRLPRAVETAPRPSREDVCGGEKLGGLRSAHISAVPGLPWSTYFLWSGWRHGQHGGAPAALQKQTIELRAPSDQSLAKRAKWTRTLTKVYYFTGASSFR